MPYDNRIQRGIGRLRRFPAQACRYEIFDRLGLVACFRGQFAQGSGNGWVVGVHGVRFLEQLLAFGRPSELDLHPPQRRHSSGADLLKALLQLVAGRRFLFPLLVAHHLVPQVLPQVHGLNPSLCITLGIFQQHAPIQKSVGNLRRQRALVLRILRAVDSLGKAANPDHLTGEAFHQG